MGYPVLTVTEKGGGIHVRQDRFLETGPADPKDNETIWLVRFGCLKLGHLLTLCRTLPLNLLIVDNEGKSILNTAALLDEREKFIPLDTSKPFKLNADTTGFCKLRRAYRTVRT